MNVKSIDDVSVNSLLISEIITRNSKLIADNFNTSFKVLLLNLGQTTNETVSSPNNSNRYNISN